MRDILLTRAEYAASRAKIDKINTRARRRGWTGRINLTGTLETRTNTGSPPPFPDHPYGAELVMVRATIDGEAPCYNGWRFLAALDALPTADGEVAWVVRCAPGISDELVDRSQFRQGWCDHCRTLRPARRHTYLVVHEVTGETKQVGSTCLKDFTGWAGNPIFLSADSTFDEQLGGLGRRPDEFTPVYVVAVAAAAVEASGWVSGTGSGPGRYPTANLVADFLLGGGKPAQTARDLIEPHLELGHQLAPKIVDTLAAAWVDRTGYEGNISAVLRSESAGVKEFGLLASTVIAYRRYLGDLEQATSTAEPPVAWRWLGSVGDKVEIEGTVKVAMTVDGYAYNTTQRLVVIEAAPTLAKLYTAASWAYEVAAGDHVILAAKVKAHDSWRDQQQTVLTRAKRLATPSPTT